MILVPMQRNALNVVYGDMMSHIAGKRKRMLIGALKVGSLDKVCQL
jgi:hypothetical protein